MKIPEAIEVDLRNLEAWITSLPGQRVVPNLRGLRANIEDACQRYEQQIKTLEQTRDALRGALTLMTAPSDAGQNIPAPVEAELRWLTEWLNDRRFPAIKLDQLRASIEDAFVRLRWLYRQESHARPATPPPSAGSYLQTVVWAEIDRYMSDLEADLANLENVDRPTWILRVTPTVRNLRRTLDALHGHLGRLDAIFTDGMVSIDAQLADIKAQVTQALAKAEPLRRTSREPGVFLKEEDEE